MKHVSKAVTMAIAMTAASTFVVSSTAVGSNDPLETRIVFSRINSATENADLLVAGSDGSDVHQVPTPIPIEALGGGFWSPDGKRLLITNLFQIPEPFRPATVRPDGSAFKVLDVPDAPFDMFCTAWSPNGERILCGFGGDPAGVFSIRAQDGGDPRRLSANPYGGADKPGGYSPDGRRIVFTRQKPGSGPNEQGALFVVNADGSHLRQITPFGVATPHDNALARWSPDGREIVFAGPEGTLFLIRPNGAQLTPIPIHVPDAATFAVRPGWSPDGAQIIFPMFVSTTHQVDLYVARRDGTDLVQITDTAEVENFADWTRRFPVED